MSDNDVNNTVADDTVKVNATTSQKSGGAKKVIGIIVAVLVVVAIGAFFALKSDVLTSPAKRVGSIDNEAILALDAFTKADKEMQAFAETKQKEFEKAAKEKAGKPGADAELQNLQRKLELEMNQKRNELMNPLQNRAEAAVASVARGKGLTVVLDKHIVIYGVEDITEEVKTIFQQEGEIKMPDDIDTSSCPVAYFDQTVVRSLRVFTEAEMRLYSARNDMMREYEKRAPSLSDSEKEALQREMSARLEALQEQIMTPLFQKVNNAVNEVAKAQNISLVLDKPNVMYGGRNITDPVVETFLSSVGASNEGQSADGQAAGNASAGNAPAAPAAAGSPAATQSK